MTEPPAWALDLRDRAWAWGNHSTPAPSLSWRTSFNRPNTTGTYWHADNRITITAGSDLLGQRITVAHECAHAMTKGEHHSLRFWWRAFRLYDHLGLTLYPETFVYEFSYMTRAIEGARAAGVSIPPGTIEAAQRKRHRCRWLISAANDTDTVRYCPSCGSYQIVPTAALHAS